MAAMQRGVHQHEREAEGDSCAPCDVSARRRYQHMIDEPTTPTTSIGTTPVPDPGLGEGRQQEEVEQQPDVHSMAQPS